MLKDQSQLQKFWAHAKEDQKLYHRKVEIHNLPLHLYALVSVFCELQNLLNAFGCYSRHRSVNFQFNSLKEELINPYRSIKVVQYYMYFIFFLLSA